MLTKRFQVALIALIVSAAYYPTILAGVSRIDDAALVESLRHTTSFNLKSLFFPAVAGGSYYRPVLVLSYLLDKFLFGAQPGMMHLVNLCLHMVNAVFVYSITDYLIPAREQKMRIQPLVAALVFGLHPVNSESVNWISGRTDVLAALFILSSTLFLLRYRTTHKLVQLAAALGLFFLATLTKEIALSFLPGFVLLSSRGTETNTSHAAYIQKRENLTFIASSATVVLLLFLSVRSAAFTSNSSRIGITINYLSLDWMHSLLIVLRTFGFYMKKLVVPYPLNFAIVEVDPLYEVLAVPLIAACIAIALRKTLVSSLFTTGIIMITPAFLIAFGQVAWTPYAERYLYLPAAFIVPAVVVYGWQWVESYKYSASARYFTILLLGIFFIITLNRSMVWKNDLELCKDTVNKSPFARDIRVVYAGLLAERGNYTEALDQLEYSRKIPTLLFDERYYLTKAYIYFRQGKIDDAIAIVEAALAQSKGTSVRALEYMIFLLENKAQLCDNNDERKQVNHALLKYLAMRCHISRDAAYLYKWGVVAGALGKRNEELVLLKQSVQLMEKNDPFKIHAMNKIAALGGLNSFDAE